MVKKVYVHFNTGGLGYLNRGDNNLCGYIELK